MILVLFFASALFWAGFEQAGSSFNLFAERYTDRQMNWTGLDVQYGSPLLSEGSFKDATMGSFIARLDPPADAESAFLAGRLSPRKWWSTMGSGKPAPSIIRPGNRRELDCRII